MTELIAKFDSAFPYEDAVAGLADPERVAALRTVLEQIASRDLVTVMAADETFQAERHGIDGFIEAWRDWAEPWERFETTVEELVQSGDKVLIFVHQTGIPHGSPQSVDSDAAGVFTIEDDRVVRVEFHLDRPTAMRLAGISPEDLGGQSSQA